MIKINVDTIIGVFFWLLLFTVIASFSAQAAYVDNVIVHFEDQKKIHI